MEQRFYHQEPITTHFSKIFEGAQEYTVLSRIQAIVQSHLMNDLYKHKIYASTKALSALEPLKSKAKNRNSFGRREE